MSNPVLAEARIDLDEAAIAVAWIDSEIAKRAAFAACGKRRRHPARKIKREVSPP
jgi:hypothetical protein